MIKHYPENCKFQCYFGEILRGMNKLSESLAQFNVALLLSNNKGFAKSDNIHILLRPEDLHVWDSSEIDDSSMLLPAKVQQFIYKGSTVDLILRLPSGKLISATEFFDEDDENLEYHLI